MRIPLRRAVEVLLCTLALVATTVVLPTAVAASPHTSPNKASDVSFINRNDGWMLVGQPSQTAKGLVERTTDGGRTWSVVGLIPFPGGERCNQPCGVKTWSAKIHFTDARHGYVFNPALAMTTDGGQTWVDLHRTVFSLATTATTVIAVERIPSSRAENNARVVRAAIGSSRWTPTKTAPVGASQSIIGQGSNAWVLTYRAGRHGAYAPLLLRSRDNGISWKAVALPAAAATSAWLLTSAAPSTLWLTYTNKQNKDVTLASGNGGASWKRVSVASSGTFAAPTGSHTGFRWTPFGAFHLWRTRTDGVKWAPVLAATATFNSPAVLAHPDSTHLHFLLSTGIYNSTDGGTHWNFVPVN